MYPFFYISIYLYISVYRVKAMLNKKEAALVPLNCPTAVLPVLHILYFYSSICTGVAITSYMTSAIFCIVMQLA